jgi:uncharacterized protein (DUF488 family)
MHDAILRTWAGTTLVSRVCRLHADFGIRRWSAEADQAGPSKAGALMCAEAVPWRCHRSLIADALTVHGIRVEDIVSKTRSKPVTDSASQSHHVSY